MIPTIDRTQYLVRRREEIRRELGDLQHHRPQVSYYDMNERRVELDDELTQIENELRLEVSGGDAADRSQS